MISTTLLISLAIVVSAEAPYDVVRQEIIEYHNHQRANVNPPATNMMKLEYSMEMERLATKWADKCVFAHPGPHESEYAGTGQNVAISGGSAPNFTSNALMNWWSEVQYYTLETNSCAPRKACGHYTQMAWATTTQVGCASKLCPHLKPGWPRPVYIYVCQYKPPGNFRRIKPYRAGSSCSECPEGTFCENRLCVAGGTQKPTTTTSTTTASTPKPTTPKTTTTTTTTERSTTISTTTTRRPTTTPITTITTTTSSPTKPPGQVTGQIMQPNGAQKAAIIRFMDIYRSAVNPTAANMKKVSYGQFLSTISTKIVRHCRFERPTGWDVAHYDGLGVTVAKVHSKLIYEKVLLDWWRTDLLYDFDSDTCQGGEKKCHPYKQMAFYNVTEIGCSASKCNDTYYVVCLYDYMADFSSQPYTKGQSASKCPDGTQPRGKLCYPEK